MPASRPVVLIAAPSSVIDKLKAGVPDHVEVLGAETHDQAVALVRERSIDLLIVCYIFDNLRPYRLLNHIQELTGRQPPALLVRALPVPLQEKEQDIRASYAPLGVVEFMNFSDQEKREGRESALARLRSLIFGHTPRH